MDDVATLRERAREAAGTMKAAHQRMNALIPTEPMFDPDPVSLDTFNEWSQAYDERQAAEQTFVETMRQLIALKAR